MSAIAATTLNGITYEPRKVNSGEYAKWTYNAGSVAAMDPSVALAFSENSKTRRVTGTVVWPVQDATTGEIRNEYGRVEFTTNNLNQSTDRTAMLAALRAFVATSYFDDAVVDNESPW
jgi:1,2-phenylacetyl-CoA epoxidase PaaB subunit